MFNADETAYYLLAKFGQKKEALYTTLLIANPAGQLVPPMIASHCPIGRSENDWMTEELFYEYMVNFFIQRLGRDSTTNCIFLK